MRYYFTIIDDGSRPVIIAAKNKGIAGAMIEGMFETLSPITKVEATRMMANGIELIQ